MPAPGAQGKRGQRTVVEALDQAVAGPHAGPAGAVLHVRRPGLALQLAGGVRGARVGIRARVRVRGALGDGCRQRAGRWRGQALGVRHGGRAEDELAGLAGVLGSPARGRHAACEMHSDLMICACVFAAAWGCPLQLSSGLQKPPTSCKTESLCICLVLLV